MVGAQWVTVVGGLDQVMAIGSSPLPLLHGVDLNER